MTHTWPGAKCSRTLVASIVAGLFSPCRVPVHQTPTYIRYLSGFWLPVFRSTSFGACLCPCPGCNFRTAVEWFHVNGRLNVNINVSMPTSPCVGNVNVCWQQNRRTLALGALQWGYANQRPTAGIPRKKPCKHHTTPTHLAMQAPCKHLDYRYCTSTNVYVPWLLLLSRAHPSQWTHDTRHRRVVI